MPATMDLGAAVLEAVYGPTPSTHVHPTSVDAVDLLDVEMPAPECNDPVAWSPSKAIRVEAPVVLKEETPFKTPEVQPDVEAPPLVGAVQDWSVAPARRATFPQRDSTRTSAPHASMKSEATTVPETPSLEARMETLITEAVTPREPVSTRNHIRRGASTYIDAVQASVRRDETGWWQRDAALPFSIAVGIVTLVLFALM